MNILSGCEQSSRKYFVSILTIWGRIHWQVCLRPTLGSTVRRHHLLITLPDNPMLSCWIKSMEIHSFVKTHFDSRFCLSDVNHARGCASRPLLPRAIAAAGASRCKSFLQQNACILTCYPQCETSCETHAVCLRSNFSTLDRMQRLAGSV